MLGSKELKVNWVYNNSTSQGQRCMPSLCQGRPLEMELQGLLSYFEEEEV